MQEFQKIVVFDFLTQSLNRMAQNRKLLNTLMW